MQYRDVVILIPCHSLEDFPTELDETQACGLLNSFAVAWHPALLAATEAIPRWSRADEPIEDVADQLIVVPEACDDLLPSGWADQARGRGAYVVQGISDRTSLISSVLAGLDSPPEIDAELVADFCALGFCFLQMELLTRQMHHFSSLDEVQLQREAVRAAEAAIAGDAEAAGNHLRACFESLLECRERFYPVDCFLLDVCLLVPSLADQHFEQLLDRDAACNVLLLGNDLAEIARDKPDLVGRMRQKWDAGTINLVGGERYELPVPLVPLESVLWDFQQGLELFESLLGRRPKTWARRRYGFSTQLPQILTKWGYHSALHVALDDGIYPDAEQSKVQWEGCDGTVIHAMTRIPLAADSAMSYLRFPQRMAETMEEDQIAALTFARWPELESPWLDDLRAMDKYAPVLGRFVSFDDFIDQTETPGRLSSYQEREYLSPFFVQDVARDEQDPISRVVRHYRRRFDFDGSRWLELAADAVLSGRVGNDASGAQELVQRIEANGPDPLKDDPELSVALQEFRETAIRRFSDVALQQETDQAGCLVLNPLSFQRRVVVETDLGQGVPVVGDVVKAVQQLDGKSLALVEVPPCGFAWFGLSAPATTAPTENSSSQTPSTVQDSMLRNEFFEVHVNETTGGIQQIKEYGRRPNRLSQQLSFRFASERVVGTPQDGEPAQKSFYAEMRCEDFRVTCDGPGLGEIVTRGAIVDQARGTRLAGFQQRLRLWRGCPFLEVQIQLEVDSCPDGSPWATYFTSRFAWNDSTAALTRSVLEGAHSVGGERFESPHFLELAVEDERTTIFGRGLPYYRKTGPRMVDAILIAGQERCRTFEFVIGVDQQFPMQSAFHVMNPAFTLATQSRKPRGSNSGWLFQVRERNVVLTRIMPAPVVGDDADHTADFSVAEDLQPLDPADSQTTDGSAFVVRLLECEGRHRRVHLSCFRVPVLARQRDLQGRLLSELSIEDGQVVLEMSAFEIADVELCFAK